MPRDRRARIVLSHHDFERTPGEENLLDILDQIDADHPVDAEYLELTHARVVAAMWAQNSDAWCEAAADPEFNMDSFIELLKLILPIIVSLFVKGRKKFPPLPI
jgi:hypothetical protein